MRKNTVKKTAVKKSAKVSQKPLSADKKINLFIAGIGASVGGLEALKLFFDNASGMAFVILQQLDPMHKAYCLNCLLNIKK